MVSAFNDSRGYVVRGFNAPGRVSQGKQSLREGLDKELFKSLHDDKEIKARGWGLAGKRLVVRFLLAGPGRGTIKDRCREECAAAKGGGLMTCSADA